MKSVCDLKLFLVCGSILILIIFTVIKKYNSKTIENNNINQNKIFKIPLNYSLVSSIESFENKDDKEKEKSVEKCVSENNLYFIYLSTKHLEQVLYRPQPVWTNYIFCIYKTKPILSLNQNINEDNQVENNYYYSLGDVILFKDYSKYIQNYDKDFELICGKPLKEETNNKETFQNLNNNYPLKPDKYIKNYNQPGVKGLKILVKNGKKPVGFTPNPIAKIDQDNGETLWIWEPIAPEGYSFLGHYVSINPNPVMPNLDTCNIRCIPNECIQEVNLLSKDIVLSKDIKIPNRLYLTSHGKYFKGTKITGQETEIKLKSHDLHKNCINFEIDDDDKIVDYSILYKNTMVDDVLNELSSETFNLFKVDFEKQIEKILLSNPQFLLNNFTNNPDDYFYNSKQKRYVFDTKLEIVNEISLTIKIKKRKYGYNELKSTDLIKLFEKARLEKKFNFSLIVNKLVYYFECVGLIGKVNPKDTFNKFDREKIIYENSVIPSESDTDDAPSSTKSGEEKTDAKKVSAKTVAKKVSAKTVDEAAPADCIDLSSPNDKCLEKDYKMMAKKFYGTDISILPTFDEKDTNLIKKILG